MLDIKYKRKPEALLNMTPMIDIVFLLLIFFLLTTNFITQEGIHVNLPQAKATTALTREDITVYVTYEGRIFLKNEEVEEAQLLSRLQSLIGAHPETVVTIKADRQTILNKVINIMDITKSAGAGRLCIATEKEFDESAIYQTSE